MSPVWYKLVPVFLRLRFLDLKTIGFLEVVHSVWNSEVLATNIASKIAAKFKLLRRVLKKWAMSLSKIKNLLKQCNAVLLVMQCSSADVG
jgi:hypothetical protein